MIKDFLSLLMDRRTGKTMKDVIKETLAFKELTPEEKEKRGILGRLFGPCADIINPTRNGRKYSDELWEKVFKDELVIEALNNGGIFGELDHPVDRQETDSTKIAICMPEAPKRDRDGHLIAYFDILDTPCGRIAYQLAKYGYKLGVSSRGNGDVIEDSDGNESVDPDTYDFQCFDLVLTPSVKAARCNMVEGLDKESINLKKALKESFDKATADEKVVMQEALDKLNIKLDECISESCADKKEQDAPEQTVEKTDEANNDGSKLLINSLQEALKSKSDLEAQVRELQEKLAVSNAKVDELIDAEKKAKNAVQGLAENARKSHDLELKVSSLEESLKQKDERIGKLLEFKRVHMANAKVLNESINSKDNDLKELNESIKTITSEKDAEIKRLTEALNTEKQTSESKVNEVTAKLHKSVQIKENYKKLANEAINKYIGSKATMIGVSAQDIKNKLEESYTLSDIDKVCEELQAYDLNMSKLPFNVGRQAKIRVTESKKDNLHHTNPDDEVDGLEHLFK